MKKLNIVFTLLLSISIISTYAQFGKLKNAANKINNAVSNGGSTESSSSANSETANSNAKAAETAGGMLEMLDPLGTEILYQMHIAYKVSVSEQLAEEGPMITIRPDFDLDYNWMIFISPEVLHGFSVENNQIYEMISGQYTGYHPLDRNQQLTIGTGGPILSRLMKIDEKTFVLYAGAQVSGHPYNVPSYIQEDDLYVIDIFSTQAGLEAVSKEKAQAMAKEIELKLKANYDAAAKADLASIQFPSAGKMNSHSDLLNFAKTSIEKVLSKDGQSFITHNIESNDWNIVYHKITGVPLYRWIRGAFAEKHPNGECWLQGFLLKQQYDGSSYGNTTFGGVIHGQMPYGQAMECGNVPQ